MRKIKFNSIYFYFLSNYLNNKLQGKRINSLKVSKKFTILEIGNEKYVASFGEFIGLFNVRNKFVHCAEYRDVNVLEGFEIRTVQQLYFDRIVEFDLEKNDGIRHILRSLKIIFTGKVSTVITDENAKMIFSNDSRYHVGEEFRFEKKLKVFKDLMEGKRYCGNTPDELIENVLSGASGEGTICVNEMSELSEFLHKNKKLSLEHLGIIEEIETFLERQGKVIYDEEIEKCKKEIKKYYDKLLNRKNRILGDLDKKISLNEEDYVRMGKAIIYNKHMIKKGDSIVNLPYYEDSGVSTLEVKLKENLTPEQNAKLYFEKAEKIKSKKKNAIARKKIVEREIDALLNRIDNIPDEPKALLEEWEKYYTKAKNRHVKGFKYYLLESGARVYVGRNSKENDQLTLHFASSDDLFFHVREAPGSHVILRSSGSKHLQSDIVRAASIAAYFSKMRNSRTVPVSYTEIKYVRKPRKAKSGTVVLTREKVIFVSPGIP